MKFYAFNKKLSADSNLLLPNIMYSLEISYLKVKPKKVKSIHIFNLSWSPYLELKFEDEDDLVEL